MARRKISVMLEFEGDPSEMALEEILAAMEETVWANVKDSYNIYADITEDEEVE